MSTVPHATNGTKSGGGSWWKKKKKNDGQICGIVIWKGSSSLCFCCQISLCLWRTENKTQQGWNTVMEQRKWAELQNQTQALCRPGQTSWLWMRQMVQMANVQNSRRTHTHISVDTVTVQAAAPLQPTYTSCVCVCVDWEYPDLSGYSTELQQWLTSATEHRIREAHPSFIQKFTPFGQTCYLL